jgi:phage regulator Rha-like protein
MSIFQNTQIALAVNQVTMSSRQIAVVVNSRHDNVKRTIETLAKKGVISFTQTEETSHEGSAVFGVDLDVLFNGETA